MKKRVSVFLAALLFTGAGVEAAQLKKLKGAFKRTPPEERQERIRARVEALAEELYQTDPTFKDGVDSSYREVLLKHVDHAYRVNTASPSRAVVVREDRFRLQGRNSLYDNLMIQGYVNRLGQRLVPEGSDSLFTFRLKADPLLGAETLATGTIYLTTGLVASLDNEAQLAYVLAHEMAHVYLDHWREKIMVAAALPEYLEKQERRQQWKMLGATVAGGLIGKQIDGRDGALVGAALGAAIVHLTQPSISLDWNEAQENEADDLAFEVIQSAGYDAREVRGVFANLGELTRKENRVSLGFIGDPARLSQRMAHAEALVQGAVATQSSLAPNTTFLVDSGRYKELMAELRRDNGIQALYHDMFRMAEDNLASAVAIRSNDPTALYYYGRVLELVGRTDEDIADARSYFLRAAENDHRNWNFGAHLHYAMTLMNGDGEQADVVQAGKSLQSYIDGFSNYQIQTQAIRQLPSHLDTLYDYMMLNGQAGWAPRLPEAPAGYVFTNWERLAPPGE